MKCVPSNFHIFLGLSYIRSFPVGIYLFKVSNRNTRAMCEICSKLIIKTPEGSRRHSDVFIVNLNLLTLNK